MVFLNSKAVGSPNGLVKTGVMVVPGTNPKSKRRLLIEVLQFKDFIIPFLFKGKSDKFKDNHTLSYYSYFIVLKIIYKSVKKCWKN